MKLTYLDIINKILSSIDSQSVSSAGDSVESEQVGMIVNRIYNEICTLRDWPWLRVVGFNKVGLGTNAWELDLPDNCMTLEYIMYNKKQLTYKTPEDMAYFLQVERTPNSTNINTSGIKYDDDPSYWTMYDDNTITFDAYDASNTTLLPSLCYIQYIKEVPNELSADTDVPILHVRYHSVLLNGAMAIAFNELAQDTAKYDRAWAEYKRGVARMVKWARKNDKSLAELNQPDYGRNGR